METVIIIILLGLLAYESWENRKLARAALEVLSRKVNGVGLDAERTAQKTLEKVADLIIPDKEITDVSPEKALEAMRRAFPVKGDPGYEESIAASEERTDGYRGEKNDETVGG